MWKSILSRLPEKRLRIGIMLVGIVLALIAFEEIADDVFQDPTVGDYESSTFDRNISGFFRELRNEERNQVAVDLTALGSISVIVAFYIVFISVLSSFRDFKGMAFISIVLLGAGVWPWLLKPLFARVRPEQSEWLVNVSHLSFPSGHSFGAAAVYIGFAYYASQYVRGWKQEIFFYSIGLLLAGLVGLSRVYLGVHHPTDVLAGWSAGAAWALLASLFYEIFAGDTIRNRRTELFVKHNT